MPIVPCCQCGDTVDTDRHQHARRGEQVTCELCEWSPKYDIETATIRALQEMPEEGPLLAFVNKARTPLWLRICKLLGATKLAPELAWHKLIRTVHPMLQTGSTEAGCWLVGLRPQLDTTQGFVDDTTYGPTYPVHPEKSYREHPMIKSLREPKRVELKRPRGTQHRCVCGEWVAENGFGRSSDSSGRPNLFGRCWCRKCAQGHNYRTPDRLSTASVAPFNNAESAELVAQLKKHRIHEAENARVVLYLSAYDKRHERLFAGCWRFADFDTACARISKALKPVYRKQLQDFVAAHPR